MVEKDKHGPAPKGQGKVVGEITPISYYGIDKVSKTGTLVLNDGGTIIVTKRGGIVGLRLSPSAVERLNSTPNNSD